MPLQLISTLPGVVDHVVDGAGAKSHSNSLFKTLKYVNKERGGGWQKRASSSFDSVLKVDQLAPTHRSEKVGGYLGFLLNWPFGFQKTLTAKWIRIHSVTQKVFFLSGTCLFLTALHMLGHLYL